MFSKNAWLSNFIRSFNGEICFLFYLSLWLNAGCVLCFKPSLWVNAGHDFDHSLWINADHIFF